MICKLAAFIDKISIVVSDLNVNQDTFVGERRKRYLWLSFSRLKNTFQTRNQTENGVQKQAIK